MYLAPAHSTERRAIEPIQTCFRPFMVSHSFCGAHGRVYFVPTGVSRSYNGGVREFPKNLSVAFADDVTVPVRYLDNQIPASVGNTLATQAAIRRKSRSKRELFFFRVRHFRYRLQAFPHDAMACRARAHTSTGMVDFDSMRKRDVENASGQSCMAVRNLF